MYVKPTQNLRDLKVITSQNYQNYSYNIWKSRAYVNEKNISPAGSPYPYNDVYRSNNGKKENFIITGNFDVDTIDDKTIEMMKSDYFNINYYNAALRGALVPTRTQDDDDYYVLNLTGHYKERSINVLPSVAFDFNTFERLPAAEDYVFQYEIKMTFDTAQPNVTFSHSPYVSNTTPANRRMGFMDQPIRTGVVTTEPSTDGFTRVILKLSADKVVNPLYALRIHILLNRPSGESAGYDYGNGTLQVRKIMASAGLDVPDYNPHEDEGGEDIDGDGVPIGILFEDVDFNLFDKDDLKLIACPLMVEGQVLESRLPLTLNNAQKEALKHIKFR